MRKRVAVVGATGIAGQQFLVALDRHSWFDVVMLAASERSAGQAYRDAIRDAKTGARRWWCAEEPPGDMLDVPVEMGAAKGAVLTAEYLVTAGYI
jgi:aspartate-semialdehyde dehydrogenase